MKKLSTGILFIMYTLLTVLGTSEVFFYQDSLGSNVHYTIYLLTFLTLVTVTIGWLAVRFDKMVVAWAMIFVGLIVGLYVATLHVNEIKVTDRGNKEVQMQVRELQLQQDEK